MAPDTDLYVYERHYAEQGFCPICGIDEAGRGPLAGPVVAAAVILPEEPLIAGLNDSKKLSEAKRLALLPVITEHAQVGVGLATHEEIDAVNILQATFLAMRRAVEQLPAAPALLLVDGNADPHLGLPTRAIVGGDAKSASIAAASIVAKCTRDRLMCEADLLYGGYGFAKHKGYPTKAHYEALAALGACPIHRRSFLHTEEKPKRGESAGSKGEAYAAEKLLAAGYRILARNYAVRSGEIDIIAQKGEVVAFVEVKTRRCGSLVSPLAAVTPAKRAKLIRAAEAYLSRTGCPLQPRFDVFALVTRGTAFEVLSYQHVEGAFDARDTHRYD